MAAWEVLEVVGALKVDPEVVLTVVWHPGWPRKPQKCRLCPKTFSGASFHTSGNGGGLRESPIGKAKSYLYF